MYHIIISSSAPDIPSITAASSKQSQNITVEFTNVPGASFYILRAETSDGSIISETPVPGSPGTVSGLQPYTNYTFSVLSVNAGGRSQPSYPVQAKTGILLCSCALSVIIDLFMRARCRAFSSVSSRRSPDPLAELKGSGCGSYLTSRV